MPADTPMKTLEVLFSHCWDGIQAPCSLFRRGATLRETFAGSKWEDQIEPEEYAEFGDWYIKDAHLGWDGDDEVDGFLYLVDDKSKL